VQGHSRRRTLLAAGGLGAVLGSARYPGAEPGSRARPVQLITRFETAAAVQPWRAIDDRVMGGRSRSTASWSPGGTLVFAGSVSLERGGGFASLRAEIGPIDLTGTRGILLIARGDGRPYRFNLRDRRQASGTDEAAQFQARFTPGEHWGEHWLPWPDFVAVRRGRPIPEPAPLEIGAIMSLGLMTGFREPGPFRLELRGIEAA